MHRLASGWFSIALMLMAANVHGQSFNIEFGEAGTAPDADHAAASLPGTWNTFGVLPSTPQPMLTITGADTGATIKNIGGTAILSADDAGTSAGDELLMDDMLISMSDPLDACLFIDGVENGEYEVLIYANTPDSTELNNVRVDFADQPAQWVGGAWPGGHEDGVTYARFTIAVSNNRIDFHSGQPGGNFQSGLNGVQIRLLIEGDLNGDGVVDAHDRAAFCATLGTAQGEPGFDMWADLNGDGVVDEMDQQLFDAISTPCAGDVVSSDTFEPPADGTTDGADLAFLLGAWANEPSCADFVTSRSFTPPPDGLVDGADLAYLLGAWGACER